MIKIVLSVILSFTFSLGLKAQSCYSDFTFQTNGLSVQFTDTSFMSQGNINYSWDFGDGSSGSTIANPFHTYGSAGTYTTCLYIWNSFCADTLCKTVVVSAPPPCNADFTYTSDTSNTVFFNNNSTPSGGYIFRWDFGDNSPIDTSRNPIHNYSNSGVYVVNLSLYFNSSLICSKSDSVYVNSCSAGFSFQSDSTGFTRFFNSSVYSQSATFNWNFGDGNFSNLENPTHTYLTSGSYTVSLSYFDSLANCSAFLSQTVQINTPLNCIAAFTLQQNLDTVFLQNTATNALFITYDFGDGNTSNQASPIHIYTQSGTYTICQTVSDSSSSCSDTFCDTVIVNVPPPCKASFSLTVNQENISIQNQGTNFTSLIYDFGDGSNSSVTNPTHSYSSSGTYTVCQTVTNSLTGCSDIFCDTVSIIVPLPCTAGFIATVQDETVSIQNLASNFTSVTYDMGNGIILSNPDPVYSYPQSGTYVIHQTVRNDSTSCLTTSSDTVTITVPLPCAANFSYQLSGDSILFQNNSTSYNRLQYDFGDGNFSTLENPIHVYILSGTYAVSLTVYNDLRNCSDTFTDSVTVSISTSCFANYEVAIDTNQANLLYLVNFSSKKPTHSYQWSFGDGSSSIGRTPIHNYSKYGLFEICLTVSDPVENCTSTFCDSVGLDSLGNVLKSNGFKLQVIDGETIGLKEESLNEEIEVYPNPFENSVYVKNGGQSSVLNYEIIGINGQVISVGHLVENEQTIGTNSLRPGIYFLKIFNDSEVVIKRLVKK